MRDSHLSYLFRINGCFINSFAILPLPAISSRDPYSEHFSSALMKTPPIKCYGNSRNRVYPYSLTAPGKCLIIKCYGNSHNRIDTVTVILVTVIKPVTLFSAMVTPRDFSAHRRKNHRYGNSRNA